MTTRLVFTKEEVLRIKEKQRSDEEAANMRSTKRRNDAEDRATAKAEAKWLNPVDVAAKQRRKNVREMASAYASGKSITQISVDFGYATTTSQKMLRDYIPSQVDINNFKMQYAAKKLRAKRIKGQI
jgi:hypothetical protein